MMGSSQERKRREKEGFEMTYTSASTELIQNLFEAFGK
jgi:hypothetical protein